MEWKVNVCKNPINLKQTDFLWNHDRDIKITCVFLEKQQYFIVQDHS